MTLDLVLKLISSSMIIISAYGLYQFWRDGDEQDRKQKLDPGLGPVYRKFYRLYILFGMAGGLLLLLSFLLPV
jgi:hypothetical protein